MGKQKQFAWAAWFLVLTASPVAALDARALHEKLITLDTHLDTPANLSRPGWDIMDRHTLTESFSQVDLPRMKQGGLDGGFFAVYTGQGPRDEAGYRRARDMAFVRAVEIREMVARHASDFSLALRADDARRIAGEGKRIVYMSIENSYPLGKDVSLLATFYRLGVRMVGPVHTTNNDFADSSTDPKGAEWRGLSPLGKSLIAEANRLGMVLDASHASDDVLDQMIALSKTPIILSHSGSKAVNDHPRNIDDARLRALAEADGVIQFNSLADYLVRSTSSPQRDAALEELSNRYGPKGGIPNERVKTYIAERTAIDAKFGYRRANFDAFMAHVLHALKLVGPDHVGIGLDWDGGGGVDGMDDVSQIPRITERLIAEGYGEADLEKLWSGNVLRLLRRAEEHAARN